MDATLLAPGERLRSRRTYTITAHVTVYAAADLAEFIRVAVFRALVDQLTATLLDLDIPFGAAGARSGSSPPWPDPRRRDPTAGDNARPCAGASAGC